MQSLNFYGRRWHNTHYNTNPIPFDPLVIDIIGAESQNPLCSIDSVAEGLMSSPSAQTLQETRRMLAEMKLNDDHKAEKEEEEEDGIVDEEEEEADAGNDADDDNACYGRYSSRGPWIKFPPPVTSLRTTGNYSRFQRTYTEDGRLVIKQAGVKRREYLKARRADGRLTLTLMRQVEENDIVINGGQDEEEDDEEQEESETEDESFEINDEVANSKPPETSYAAVKIAIGCFSPEEGGSPVHRMPAAILRAVKS